MSGIYIHVPFCKQACSYCDFYFITRQEHQSAFVDALLAEIASYRESPFSREPVDTIYFGGGTPSRLHPKDFGRIFEALRHNFDTNQCSEVTVEMNPDDVTPSYLGELRRLGVTRVSMGIQSFQPRLLDLMHRAHTASEAISCMKYLQQAGFTSWSVDLIYGNPGQSLSELDDDIDILLQDPPPHISAYSLTIEPSTRLGKLKELGRLQPPEDDIVAEQFDHIGERLASAGIDRYEVSNYAREGHRARHNSHYWRHINYLGLGPAAHSFWWDSAGRSARRWYNPADFKAYIQAEPDAHFRNYEHLDLRILAEERIMLALRTSDGISPDLLHDFYDYDLNDAQKSFILQMQEEGRLEESDALICTNEGLRIADRITLELISRQKITI